MGRRKIEVKRIEDKNTRQVTFSKRRGGLANKARHLSILCDADIAGIIFSSRGKLYEFCSGNSSVEQIISKYHKTCLDAAKARTTPGADHITEFPTQHTEFRTCKELLEAVTRLVEGPKVEELNITDFVQLEEELDAALMQTRARKTQLMMQHVSTLNEKEKKLTEENKQMEQQVASAMMGGNGGNDQKAGLNDIATNRINSSRLLTLPLFPG